MIDQGTLLAQRYEVRWRLGAGGDGEVWLAHDRAQQRPVAVKLVCGGGAEDRRRFEDQVRAQAPLAHHAIVRLLDVGVHEGALFLVMAYMAGRPLSSLLWEGPLASDRVGRLGGQVAGALAHAHRHGVVHRDVKPGNVLVDDDQAHLTDFGTARRGRHERARAPDSLVGGVAHVAPEQVNDLAVTGVADVYALGLVLLEALTGQREYPGAGTETAMARLRRPPRVPPDLPRPWPELLTHMTAADPADRFTAAEVAMRVEALDNLEEAVAR